MSVKASMAQRPTCITAVICTRNRGSSVMAALETVLANTPSNFEVIVVDQSTNEDTARAVEPFCTDPRFHYVRTPTQGLGVARNIGLAEACSAVVAFTDDDCTVPANWLARMNAIFERYPRVAVAFCNVAPAPYDPRQGFIPHYLRRGNQLVRTMRDKCRARGMGAGMVVRKSAILATGGFDEHLGAGGLFPSCEDGDIAVRALINGWWVYETDEATVVHYGFRNWSDGRELTKRDWIGIGAAYAKPVRRGYWRVTIVIAYEVLNYTLWQPFLNIFRAKRPQGLRRFVYFWVGFLRGMGTPVDGGRLVYAPRGGTTLNHQRRG